MSDYQHVINILGTEEFKKLFGKSGKVAIEKLISENEQMKRAFKKISELRTKDQSATLVRIAFIVRNFTKEKKNENNL